MRKDECDANERFRIKEAEARIKDIECQKEERKYQMNFFVQCVEMILNRKRSSADSKSSKKKSKSLPNDTENVGNLR